MGSSQSAPHPQGKTITGIGFVKHGPALESLQKVKFPYPHGFDASSNVVIKVHASSINPVDKMLIEGGLKRVTAASKIERPLQKLN